MLGSTVLSDSNLTYLKLIYELHLCALNENLPLVNQRTHQIFKAASIKYKADYIVHRYFRAFPHLADSEPQKDGRYLVSYALRFGLCTREVLDFLLAWAVDIRLQNHIEEKPFLPRRLFSSLAQRNINQTPWSPLDEPLPFLHYLSNVPHFSNINVNIHEGYPLSRAVHAGHIPLITFLLSKGARPNEKDALAVRIAIRKRDLSLVQLLIERNEDTEYSLKAGNRKRRRLEDRVEVTTVMLSLAVEVDARDIVEYFMDKGARPDMKTLHLMIKRGIA